jgi:site-specific DNA-methyltransferase (adenine-specific)
MSKRRGPATSSVGRARPRSVVATPNQQNYSTEGLTLVCGDALAAYPRWPSPDVIVSDGAYGVLGFDGDTAGHLDIPAWYEAHVAAWAKASKPSTTLWFWNSEIGWAMAHPVLEKHGFRYVSCNVWNKGRGHIAGNVSTATIRRFPVVTEVCALYVVDVKIQGLSLKQWLLSEWKRAGLPQRLANTACGVKDAATRKYLTQSHLWYFPPPSAFERIAAYANAHGERRGRPYFSLDGSRVLDGAGWSKLRSRFECPHGVTNVWERPALRDDERIKTADGRAVHLNQKPLDLMDRIIEAASVPGEVIWEPFGGLFSAAASARRLARRAYAAEVDPTYYAYGLRRFTATR